MPLRHPTEEGFRTAALRADTSLSPAQFLRSTQCGLALSAVWFRPVHRWDGKCSGDAGRKTAKDEAGDFSTFVLDQEGDMAAILQGIRGLGGTVLKTNVDLQRAKLIQSTLARSVDRQV